MATNINESLSSNDRNPCCAQLDTALRDALEAMKCNSSYKIPLVVRLLENPASPIALPGNIDIYRHDCLHLLLNRSFSLSDEAFVIGFTMGNAEGTNWLHLEIFKLCSRLLYPKPYRFNGTHFEQLHLGVFCGRRTTVKNLNRFDFHTHDHQSLGELRQFLGIVNTCLPTADCLLKGEDDA